MAGGITADSQGGKIILAAALMLAYTIISVSIRLQTRWPWRRSFRKEDAVLLAATAVSIGYTATLAIAVENGFGTRETMEAALDTHIHVSVVERTLSISFVLFFLTEGLGTISYGLFLGSLAQDDGRLRTAIKAANYLTGVSTVVAMIVSAVYAARRQSLSFEIWVAFGVIHAFILLLMFGSITSMLSMSRMPWWKKARAVLWFGLSIALIGVIAVRLVFTPKNIFHTGFTIDAVDLLIIMIVEMHFNVINASYPNLLVFAEKTSTGLIHAPPRSLSMYTLPNSDISNSNTNTTTHKQSSSFSRTFKFPGSSSSPGSTQPDTPESQAPMIYHRRYSTSSSPG